MLGQLLPPCVKISLVELTLFDVLAQQVAILELALAHKADEVLPINLLRRFLPKGLPFEPQLCKPAEGQTCADELTFDSKPKSTGGDAGKISV